MSLGEKDEHVIQMYMGIWVAQKGGMQGDCCPSKIYSILFYSHSSFGCAHTLPAKVYISQPPLQWGETMWLGSGQWLVKVSSLCNFQGMPFCCLEGVWRGTESLSQVWVGSQVSKAAKQWKRKTWSWKPWSCLLAWSRLDCHREKKYTCELFKSLLSMCSNNIPKPEPGMLIEEKTKNQLKRLLRKITGP